MIILLFNHEIVLRHLIKYMCDAFRSIKRSVQCVLGVRWVRMGDKLMQCQKYLWRPSFPIAHNLIWSDLSVRWCARPAFAKIEWQNCVCEKTSKQRCTQRERYRWVSHAWLMLKSENLRYTMRSLSTDVHSINLFITFIFVCVYLHVPNGNWKSHKKFRVERTE